MPPTAVAISGSPSRTRLTPALAIYYEHPDWYRPLFTELDRRGVPFTRLHAAGHAFDPSASEPHRVVLNRMSPSAYTRGGADCTFYTLDYLAHLERLGVRVINGVRAWSTEISKARQLTLLQHLGLSYPRSRVIHHWAQAAEAADGLRFPVVVKPNIGGSGAGILRFETREALEQASRVAETSLGVDGVALVQEFLTARDGRIVRVEVLDGRFLYAIRIYSSGDTFNLCPADVCRGIDGAELSRIACAADTPSNNIRVEGYTPPAEIIAAVERITAAAGIEIGGVEYLIDEATGTPVFYDINAPSNFVADAPRVIGFDPFARLADWLEVEIARVAQEVA